MREFSLRWLSASAPRLRIAAMAVALLSASPAVAQLDGNFDEAKVAPYILPDPLVMADGRRVTTGDMWHNERRPELIGLFEATIYGASPRSGNLRYQVADLQQAKGQFP